MAASGLELQAVTRARIRVLYVWGAWRMRLEGADLQSQLGRASIWRCLLLGHASVAFLLLQEYMRKQQQEAAKREAAEKQQASAAAAKRQAALRTLLEKQKEVGSNPTIACGLVGCAAYTHLAHVHQAPGLRQCPARHSLLTDNQVSFLGCSSLALETTKAACASHCLAVAARCRSPSSTRSSYWLGRLLHGNLIVPGMAC